MEALQSTGTAISYGNDGLTVLEKRWIEAPAETTSVNLDSVVKHRSESDNSKQSDSPSSQLATYSGVVDNVNQAILDYCHRLAKAMLQTIDITVRTSLIVSTDSSTPVLDYYLRYIDASAAENEIEGLFSQATFIDFEPGMTNEFSEGLETVIELYGDKALLIIEELVLGDDVKSSIAMEALQYVGNTPSGKWHDERRKMLERCLLESTSAWVRDGAGLGLASLDDPDSIPSVEEAIQQETSAALHKDLTLVLHQLRDTLRDQ